MARGGDGMPVAASAAGWRAADAWYLPGLPPADLASALATGWTMRSGGGRLSLVPDGCVEVLWIDNGAAVVCGPETTGWSFQLPAGTEAVGIRFRPGVAGSVLGVEAHEIAERRVALADVLGARRVRYLTGELGEAGDRLAVLTRHARGWVEAADEPDPVAAVVAGMLGERPGTSVAELAAETGRGGRQLHRRCLAAFGYGPATLRRILRLQRFLALARSSRRGLADLASEAGYTDQSHLSRDSRMIAGATPTELAWRGRGLLLDDRSVHDAAAGERAGWAA